MASDEFDYDSASRRSAQPRPPTSSPLSDDRTAACERPAARPYEGSKGMGESVTGSGGSEFEPAWSDIHYAHVQRREISVGGDRRAAIGQVIEIGDDYFVLRTPLGSSETRFTFAEVTGVTFR